MDELTTAQPVRVFAVDPYTRGIGFAVLEGRNKLIDWGLKEARVEKHVRCLRLTEDLIDKYQPDVVVFEDIHDENCRRCSRVRELIQAIERLTKEKKVEASSFSCRAIQSVFSTSQDVTKQEIA